MINLLRPTLILPTLILLALAGTSSAGVLESVYEWKYIDYNWESESQKLEAVENGEYDYETILPVDTDIISGGRVLVTTPRSWGKNPASLSVVSEETGEGGPLLEPYPSWEWHKIGNCHGITSVNRIFIDKCGRIWVVDSGKIENEQVCPAQILAFDQNTDRLLERVRIPDHVTHNSADSSKGRLEIQAVETQGDYCQKTWTYIGDPEGYGLVIWDGEDIWRLEHDVVYSPDPTATLFTVAGTNLTLELGVTSVLITPDGYIDENYLLFKPMASQRGYGATLNSLHQSKNGSYSVQYYMSNFTIPSQEIGRTYTKTTGTIIAGFPTELCVACWNLQVPLTTEAVGIPDQDSETMQFISAVKTTVVSEDIELVRVLSNRYPMFLEGTVDFSNVNFRILGSDVLTLTNGTVCEVLPYSSVPSMEEKFFFKLEDE